MRIRRYVNLAIVIFVIGTIFLPSTYAGGRYHGSRHGHHHGYGYYSGSSINIGLGFLFSPFAYGYPYSYPYGYPYGYYPYYAPAPVYVVPAERPPARVVTRQTTHTVTREKSAYCREYTKKILVDGKEEQAYGTACLQDDGSWRIMN